MQKVGWSAIFLAILCLLVLYLFAVAIIRALGS